MMNSTKDMKPWRAVLWMAGALVLAGCGGSGTSSNTGGNGGGGGGGPFATILQQGPSFGDSQAAINEAGLMVGEIPVTNTNFFADSWPIKGQFSALPGPGQKGALNNLNTSASCLNNSGVIAGSEFNGGTSDSTPIAWQNNNLINLKFPTGTETYNLFGIDNQNQIVGENGALLTSGVTPQGYYWPSLTAEPVALNPVGFYPIAINNKGEAVGVQPVGSSYEFFKIDVNSTATATNLGFSAPQAVNNSQFLQNGIAINDSGTIVLTSGSALNMFELSSSGVKTQIGTGDCPEAINAQGDVVGTTVKQRAFIYTPAKGVVDLNTYLNPKLGITVTSASAINSAGQVLAQGSSTTGGLLFLALQLPAGTF